MTYSKAQFIAYGIYTGRGHTPDRYIGLADEAADVRQRVKLMTEAVNAAGNWPGIDPRPDVLKIFIAPEFYFRGVRGGYTDLKYVNGEGAGRDPNSIVGGLANAVQDARWKHWLFVFGTSIVVAGALLPEDRIDPKTGQPYTDFIGRPIVGKTIALLNIALVQKGGYASEEERTSKAVAVIKDLLSPVDWQDGPGVMASENTVQYFPRPVSYASEVNTPGLGGSGGGSGGNGGSIFKLDDITFGLEVCADHGLGRLKKAKPQAGDTFVQIQLVPSGGATITPARVAALKGGLVCNVDGASTGLTTNAAQPEDKAGFHTQLFSVLSDGQPSGLSQMEEIPSTALVIANADLAEVQKVFWLPPDNGVKNMEVWPHLAIYPPQDIPAPVAATG